VHEDTVAHVLLQGLAGGHGELHGHEGHEGQADDPPPGRGSPTRPYRHADKSQRRQRDQHHGNVDEQGVGGQAEDAVEEGEHGANLGGVIPSNGAKKVRARQRFGKGAHPVDDAGRIMLDVMELLVVEDDDAIAAPLVEALERAGFEAVRVATGREALARAGDVDLVLLDLGLPDMDGSEVCRQIRARASTPIIVLTARGDEADRVLGLELGADDYVVKPFGTRELIARVRAVARRAAPGPEPEGPQQIGSLVIDRRTRRVTIDGEELALTPKEFDLLALLGEDPGAVVTREHIMDEVWDPHWYGPTKTLDVHIASLRRKLGDPTWVETVRSVGFRLRDHS